MVATTILTENSIVNYADGSIISGTHKFVFCNRFYTSVVWRYYRTCICYRVQSVWWSFIWLWKKYVKTIWGTDNFLQPSENLNISPFIFIIDDENISYIRYNVVPDIRFKRNKNYIRIYSYPGLVCKKLISNLLNLFSNPIFYVGSTRNGENTFLSLKECTEYISENSVKNATVYVDSEIFDLVNEYGQDYLNSIQSDTNKSFGLKIGNNTHFIFAEGSKVVFNYTGTNEDCAEYFSAFNIYGSCIIENANVEVTNARYCVHEDLPVCTNIIPQNCITQYINCIMKHNGNTIGNYIGTICIGAGTNRNTVSIIDGGKYTCGNQYPWAISYHNFYKANYGDYPSRIIFKNVWVNNGIRFGEYGDSVVDAEISGCYIPNGYTKNTTHFNITEWNNVI